eukprot:SAG31_NODE_9071_length_1340_cov_1.358582_2_plen_95_part_00
MFGLRITFHSDVEDFFKVARLEAPLTRAYSTTWDVSLIFNYYVQAGKVGVQTRKGHLGPLSNQTMSLMMLWDKVLIVAKIKIGFVLKSCTSCEV